MDRYLSPFLFAADFSNADSPTRKSYELTTARNAGFKEEWLQQAIVKDPEIVLGPCREARLIGEGEPWAFWGKEIYVRGVGSIDVLLLSQSGRVAIVETKLAYNSEARREVVAQVLEYAINLASARFPTPPRLAGVEVRREDIQDKIKEPLLIIASDELDPRAVRLTNEMIGKNLNLEWDLALVEVSIFEQKTSQKSEYLLAPHLNRGVKVEPRYIVHVHIDDERTDVDVKEENSGTVTVTALRWNRDKFFAEAQRGARPSLLHFANGLQELINKHPAVSFDFGRGKMPTLIMRKGQESLLILRLDGFLGFTLPALPRALGEECAAYYRRKLEGLFPVAMKMAWPSVKLSPETEERDLAALLQVLEEVLAKSDSGRDSEPVTPAP
jgi:hypothetical protein